MHLLATFDILGADDPEFGIFKLIVPIIIAIFWVVAQVLSSIGKKKPKSPQEEAEYPVSLPPQAPMPQPRPQQVPKQQRQVTHRVDTRQQQRQRQQAQRSAPPPLQVRQQPQPAAQRFEVPAASTAAAITGTQLGSPDDRKSSGPNANQRLRALLRPGNLKKEFILTEILQPPVGMRQDRV